MSRFIIINMNVGNARMTIINMNMRNARMTYVVKRREYAGQHTGSGCGLSYKSVMRMESSCWLYAVRLRRWLCNSLPNANYGWRFTNRLE
uniref:Uncharacterized protein n=1 Tax=Oryza barthii TaxID=65489 RepID=A0A0D3EYG0_9ORYZ